MTTAKLIKREVSDGVIAPGYEPEALEILRAKRKGSYNIVQVDPDYEPAALECKQVFGVTFEQGHNNCRIDEALLEKLVTEEQADLPASAKRDLLVALITLKYTQSNSVCYAVDGQAIGVGAGQQSRIHCTRLAGGKADTWHLRQCDKVLNLPFLPQLGRAERDNVIDGYINKNEEDVCADGIWQKYFTDPPRAADGRGEASGLSRRNRPAWRWARDAFFPFSDNIERAHRSGVRYIAQPGGSIRDDAVIDCLRQATEWSWPLRVCGCSTINGQIGRSAGMKLLVVGGGGREHAIIRKLKENPAVTQIYCRCPATAASPPTRCCVPIGAKDIDGHGAPSRSASRSTMPWSHRTIRWCSARWTR